ncbi:hypothetical protein LV84_02902 [Algoriphagus ratkowskyi]|uniref:Outer membrane protein beta-barrel domain-containing protein n=1 Tax=Algoriphagus ratkowskyi TaxID=57028 RepID=A0A2W7R1V3_9BACT|nr:hypothetical protein [Algoriphagus ratkowskyi]PZX54748.1 hypothetical protein LV84_02902 [Algoriphagus ratkowskyi]TXD77054.1 hypothetical protein ESW18_14710 [Algoriphagus ratkowskyi]
MRFTLMVAVATLILIFSFALVSKAQLRDYNTMIGVTAGTNIGVTAKQFISAEGAVDLLIYRRWKGLIAAALYEHHLNIRELRGLEWYFGGGAHYGMWKDGKGDPPWVEKIDQDYNAFGIDAIVGLEYNINRSNFYVGFYWKPAYNFTDFTKLWEDDAAFTLRYSL